MTTESHVLDVSTLCLLEEIEGLLCEGTQVLIAGVREAVLASEQLLYGLRHPIKPCEPRFGLSETYCYYYNYYYSSYYYYYYYLLLTTYY